jgi:3-methyladenine DNA glycosylase AlkC
MEPLKEMFGPAYYKTLAHAFKTSYKSFAADKFLNAVLGPIESMALNERMHHTTSVLHQYLPPDYKKNIALMKEVIPQLKPGYTNLVFPDYVRVFGTSDFSTSLDALKYFTRFGSSEFAIRTFLKLDLEKTLPVVYSWSEDDNFHVRRLASEGSRPRLPWSFKLDAIIQKPALTTPILENLKTDNELYVRKSVANHLNDFSKDSPEHLLALIKAWDKTNPHTAWIIKRGCRSLLKQGDKKSMAVFNLTRDVKIAVKKFRINKPLIRLNEELVFQFDLVSEKTTSQRLMIDYRIHYYKKSGVQLPKVFKLKEIDLKAGEKLSIIKKQRFQDFTTRKHYSGTHVLEILINGKVVQGKRFEFLR